MLYFAYQCQDDLMEPIRAAAAGALDYWGDWARAGGLPGSRRMAAQWEMVSRMRMSHHRPDYGITAVTTGNREATVTEEATFSTPFGTLLRFRKDVDIVQPKVLLVAPLSGHFATLLRATVRTLLADHDVYITDWHNARDVPVSAGRFGFEDYVEHVIRFLEVLGPGANVIAVCQPCVQVLAATAIMAEDDNPATPKTMTLMAGPVDTRINPTKVNELATSKPIRWFEDTLLASVPARHRGGGRRVYPGFIQLMAFMTMNMERHVKQHQALYDHLARGETAEAEAIKTFYDEYFAVLDLPAEFYIETVDFVFQRALLAKGELTFRGRTVNPKAIRRTALLTVEGERDDICALGQTVAAHDLCSSLRPFLKRHHMQAGVGHYGVFSGRKWEGQIYPNVRNMILANA
ncbi:polyhydroxyalkanoate depolymerase [Prosthecodimorpha staleyi]|uniref:Polyhydroxyalkanoate depolymerase n=1 Tax=Prosthecodimorpha staleyi TaxID=2840188 RepID=A0A947DC23_9HYPH|nr:polyhydroxyalkanoate depolymerase [Prosthecodimorpha staleyi]MBT9291794.1 polyhydroxyalkanoate depolymerase [Prosthecodimorpha staleyi]